MNVQYFLPDQLEGQLAELPEVVSGELALLVVVGQRLGRNTPDKESRFNTSQVVCLEVLSRLSVLVWSMGFLLRSIFISHPFPHSMPQLLTI